VGDVDDGDICDRRGFQFALSLLSELDTLRPPHVASWAVVVQRLAYPRVFGVGLSLGDAQKVALTTLCSSLAAMIEESVGRSTTYMGPECLTALASALCDAQLWDAEHRLCCDQGAKRPLSAAVHRLLAVGVAGVSVSRSLAAPLLVALVRLETYSSATDSVAELLVSLVLHQEAVIQDGALSHAPPLGHEILDAEGLGSCQGLSAVCPTASALSGKFGHTGGLVRILTISALDLLHERSSSTPVLVKAILQLLLRRMQATLDRIPQQEGPAMRSATTPRGQYHKVHLRGWQALAVLGSRADRQTAAVLLPDLFRQLAVPHVPDIREYQELLACALCSRFDDLAIEAQVLPALRLFDCPVQVSASLLILASYLLQLWSSSPETALRPLTVSVLRAVLPYLGHNSAYVRAAAAWGAFHFVESAAEMLGALVSSGEETLIREIHRFLKTNGRCKSIRERLRPVFIHFDPMARSALSYLVDRSEVLPNSRNAAMEAGQLEWSHAFFDNDFRPTRTILEFLKAEVGKEMEASLERADPTAYPYCSDEWRARLYAALAPPPGDDTDQHGTAASLQDTPTPSKHVPGSILQPELDVELGPGAQRKIAHTPENRLAPLVVVASLVDLPANLAGLCRTSEIFSCEALFLANAQVVKESAFLTVSVNAERWLQIWEARRGAGLRACLLNLRRRGYTLVGLEQTHDSKTLGEWAFPQKTALILGNEKTGIDADLLQLLDVCVEIPQTGHLRSLNVQTSGSMAIWEYVRQQRRRCGNAAAES